jgi:hypothetical protein
MSQANIASYAVNLLRISIVNDPGERISRLLTGPPLEVSPALFERVLAGWIEQGLFGLEDQTQAGE